MGLETWSQRSLRLALELVRSLEGEEPEVKEIYGALCHSFPVMVRQCGLVQALAFAAGKAALGEEGGRGGEEASRERARARAYRLLLDHVGRVLGVEDPVQSVAQGDALLYMGQTRRVLGTWAYLKRFAASVLGVHTGVRGEPGQGEELA